MSDASSGTKWAVALVGVVVLIVAFILLRGGGDSSGDRAATTGSVATTTAPAPRTRSQTGPTQTEAPALTTIRVAGGKPQGGVARIKVSKGDPVRLRVVSDTADEVHVHGYDLKKDVRAGGSVIFAFPATIDGRFVVELESSATQLAELDVEP